MLTDPRSRAVAEPCDDSHRPIEPIDRPPLAPQSAGRAVYRDRLPAVERERRLHRKPIERESIDRRYVRPGILDTQNDTRVRPEIKEYHVTVEDPKVKSVERERVTQNVRLSASSEPQLCLIKQESNQRPTIKREQRLCKKLIKRELIDRRYERPGVLDKQNDTRVHPEIEEYQVNIEDPTVKSVKPEREHVTQNIQLSVSPASQLCLIKQEPNRRPTVPIEFNNETEILKFQQRSIKREITQPQYREILLQNPVKREPFRREVDINQIHQRDPDDVSNSSSPLHPIKQELNQFNALTRYQTTKNLPVIPDLQQSSIQQDLIRKSSRGVREVTLQPSIKREPYWPQLDLKGVQKTELDLLKTQTLEQKQHQIDSRYYTPKESINTEKNLQQKTIKQELIHQRYPTEPDRIPGIPSEHAFRKVPPRHHPEICPQKEVAFPINIQPPQLSIKQDLKDQHYPGKITEVTESPLGTRKKQLSWHRPEPRYHNELGNILSQPTQKLMTRQYDRVPEIPVQSMKKEPFWFEQGVSGWNRNAANFEMAQHKSIKQEQIHRHTSTGTPLQSTVKNEPILNEYAPTNLLTISQYVQQLRESMAHQQPQNTMHQLIKPEPFCQRVPTLGMQQQQHQLHQMIRQNYHQQNLLSTHQHETGPFIMAPIQQTPPAPAPPQKLIQQHKPTSTNPLPIPEVPLLPVIPDTHRLQQNMSSDILRQPFQSAQLTPNPLLQNNVLPGYQQSTTTQPWKRSRKDPTHGTTDIPIMPPQVLVTQHSFWHQQELLRQQHLASNRLITPIPETHRHQRYQNYPQNVTIRPEVPLQFSSRPINVFAEVLTVQQLAVATRLAAPSKQKPKSPPKRATNKPPEKPSSNREFNINNKLNPFWLQQELLRRQRLAAGRPVTPIPDTQRHQQYQNYPQNVTIGPEVPLQFAGRPTNSFAEVPTVQQLTAATHMAAPSDQKPKPRPKRATKKPPEKPSSNREQITNCELQWQQHTARQQSPPPPQPPPLDLAPSQRNLPASWQHWQPLASPLASRPRPQGPARPRPHEDPSLQQRRQIIPQQRSRPPKRSKGKPSPFDSILEMFHQQENQRRQGTSRPGGPDDPTGRILRAALSVNNNNYYTPYQ